MGVQPKHYISYACMHGEAEKCIMLGFDGSCSLPVDLGLEVSS